MNKETFDFVIKHQKQDIYSVALLTNKNPKIDKELALRQIVGLQKIENKVPTFYQNKHILYPTRLSIEQSSSEITAKHKALYLQGHSLIDLTGGFGIDTYFLSKKFHQTTYVEKNKELCHIVQHNFNVLDSQNITIVNEDSNNFIKNCDSADWIYIDPARRSKIGKKVYKLDELEPNLLKIKEFVLSITQNLMIKLSPMIDISVLRNQLPEITEIQVVAVKNECKELIAIVEKESTIFRVKTFNYIDESRVQKFEYIPNKSSKSNVLYTNIVKKYLYEPNSAILKAEAYNYFSDELKKLHINSHLFTTDKNILDFQGRCFLVDKVYDFNKKGIKEFISETKTANISTRNFPLSAKALKQKLKIKDGGEWYVFGTTLADGKKVLIKTKKSENQ